MDIHQAELAAAHAQVKKSEQDGIMVSKFVEVCTLDYIKSSKMEERPWGVDNDVGQTAWGRTFGLRSYADCMELSRNTARGYLRTFYNMGGCSSATYFQLFVEPRICTPEEFLTMMGGDSQHYRVTSSFPDGEKKRVAALMGFPSDGAEPGTVVLEDEDEG